MFAAIQARTLATSAAALREASAAMELKHAIFFNLLKVIDQGDGNSIDVGHVVDDYLLYLSGRYGTPN